MCIRDRPWLCGSADMLQEALDCCFDERLQRIVENLQQLYEQLRELGYENRITFDLGKLPHLNYYSGILFEGFVPGIGTSVLLSLIHIYTRIYTDQDAFDIQLQANEIRWFSISEEKE